MADGCQTVIRNGYQPERSVQNGIGHVAVQVPKTRDLSVSRIHLTSSLLLGLSGPGALGRAATALALTLRDIDRRLPGGTDPPFTRICREAGISDAGFAQAELAKGLRSEPIILGRQSESSL